VDGWISADVAQMIARAMPQPGARSAVAAVRARMEARQRAHEQKKKVSVKRQRMFERAKGWA
jgi:hypothetical protein